MSFEARPLLLSLVVSALCAAAPAASHAASDRVRFGLINLWHDFPRYRYASERLASIASEIRRLGLDVVALPEASTVPGLYSRFLGGAFPVDTAKWLRDEIVLLPPLLRSAEFSSHFYPTEGRAPLVKFGTGGFTTGVGLISRFPIIGKPMGRQFESQAPLPLSPSRRRVFKLLRMRLRERRTAVRYLLDAPGGRLAVFVVHLTPEDQGVRAKQALELRTFVEESIASLGLTLPPAVLGDFNAQPDEDSVLLLTRQRGWRDHFDEVPIATCCRAPVPEDSVAPSPALAGRLDYILTGPGGSVTLSERGTFAESAVACGAKETPVFPSDHLGIWAELTLEGALTGR